MNHGDDGFREDIKGYDSFLDSYFDALQFGDFSITDEGGSFAMEESDCNLSGDMENEGLSIRRMEDINRMLEEVVKEENENKSPNSDAPIDHDESISLENNQCTVRGTFNYFRDTGGEVPPIFENGYKNKILLEMRYPRNIRSNKWCIKERIQLTRGVRHLSQNLILDRILEENREEFRELKKVREGMEKDRNNTNYSKPSFFNIKRGLEVIQKMSNEELDKNIEGLDWHRVSSQYVKTKSPANCFIQWTVNDCSAINKNGWRGDELQRLKDIIVARGPYNWKLISEEHGNGRTPSDCFIQYQRKLNTSLIKSKWMPEEDDLLRKAVEICGEKNWQKVASLLEGRTGQQCLHRWYKSLSPYIKKGKWTKAEDEVLMLLVGLYGDKKWSVIQEFVPGKTDIQCRERWKNVLDPSLSQGPWSEEEDRRLSELVRRHGEGRWAWIASNMINRTDNQCLRRWKIIMKTDTLLANSVFGKQKDGNDAKTYNDLLNKQNRLPKLRLAKLLKNLNIKNIDHQGFSMDEKPSADCKIFKPLPLDPYNVKAFKRLLLLFQEHNTKEKKSEDLKEYFGSREYRLLYTRFESLFLWPMLLSLCNIQYQH